MRITYYALRDVRVGDEIRQAGDLVPEAMFWPYLSGYLTDGHLAPVLVATLPEEQQEMLLEWHDEIMGTPVVDSVPDEEPDEDEGETTELDDVVVPEDFDPETADKRTKVYRAWLAQQEKVSANG